MKFIFSPDDLRTVFAMAKTVKPESNDLCLKFVKDTLILFSSSKRRYVRAMAVAQSVSDLPSSDYESDEFYITVDRSELFESKLDSVSISVTEKSFTIHASSADQSRSATLKKRSDVSKRSLIPEYAVIGNKNTVKKSSFIDLIKQVSCSAQVKETKTEEDMRINQIHFYSEKACAVSFTRFYGSVSFLPSVDFDLSIISNDVPLIKTFCSKCSGDFVYIYSDSSRLFVEDPTTKSVLVLSKVSSKKPVLNLIDRTIFNTEILLSRDSLIQSLEWSVTALDGTQRVSLKTSENESNWFLEFNNGAQELSKIPVKSVKGDVVCVDFPAKYLLSIIKYTTSDMVILRIGSMSSTKILEISSDEDGEVKTYHYLNAMKQR